MVGIGGGVPSVEADTRLGNVVISQPFAQHGGVGQYDFGKTGLEGCFTRTGRLNAPPTILWHLLLSFDRITYDDASSCQGSSLPSTACRNLHHSLLYLALPDQ